jgi:hypothetical protein
LLLSDELQYHNISMPNTPEYILCVSWFEAYFKSCGDSVPNSSIEIHIEKTEKNTIHEVYKAEMHYYGWKPLEYARFVEVWDKEFSHVKIREYKAVTGKCDICAKLTGLRKKSQNYAFRQAITDMHALHRVTYMSERRAYRRNITNAMNEPEECMSIILDGMAQNHTNLPYIANQKDFPNKLRMHLQGVIEHHQEFVSYLVCYLFRFRFTLLFSPFSQVMYRTFENVRAGCNLTIHVLLLQLESRIRRFKKLPPTVYIQIDGGSENANKYVLACCEFLVHVGLTKKIILTRLPVGHTHEGG